MTFFLCDGLDNDFNMRPQWGQFYQKAAGALWGPLGLCYVTDRNTRASISSSSSMKRAVPVPPPSLHMAGSLRHGQAINNTNNERVCSEHNDFMKLHF